MVKIKFKNNKAIELEKYSKDPDSILYDRKLVNIMDRMKIRQDKKFDNVIILFGDVGTGKTTLAFTMLQYMLNGNMNISNVGVGTSDSLKKISRVPDKSGVIFDDASTIFYSSDHNAKKQKLAIKILHLCRSKGLTIFITTPDLFKINPYVVTQRSRMVIKCYTKQDYSRGFFCAWDYAHIKPLYYLEKKNQGMIPGSVRPQLIGIFGNYIPPFELEYEKLKRRAMKELIDDKVKLNKQEKKTIYIEMLERLIKFKEEGMKVNYTDFARIVGLSDATISKYKNEIGNETEELSQIEAPVC